MKRKREKEGKLLFLFPARQRLKDERKE